MAVNDLTDGASNILVDNAPDAIELEILKGAFQSVANEMALAVELAAYSLAITEGRDFSGSLYDSDGSLVSQGQEDLPVHVGTAQHTVRSVMQTIGVDQMKNGEVFIMNDPFLGGTHVNDVRLVMPVFDAGKIVAFLASTGHWTDVGGMVPGSFCQEGRECFQEGLRITPATIVDEHGDINHQLLQLIKANVRMPDESEGDLRAQIAACRAGYRRLVELIEKYGSETIRGGMAEIQNYAERMFRAEVAKLPDGEYRWEEYVDEDFYTGEPKGVRLRLVISGEELLYDFSDSDDAALCSINTTFIGTFAAVFVAAKAIYPDIPFNAGIMRSIEIKTVPNSIVDARPPTAVGGFGATSWEKICGCCLGVFSHFAPDRTIAGSYNLINTYFGGYNEASGKNYVCYVWSEGGAGGTARQDGPSAMQSFFNSSTRNIPVEILERSAPIMIERYELLQDSAGAGKNRGGMGTTRVVRLLGPDALLSIAGDRHRFAASGLEGGSDSTTQGVILETLDGISTDLGACTSNHPLRRGEMIDIRSMGGAGFGPPLERKPEAILADVRNEYTSIAKAFDDYGVVIREVDREAALYEIDYELTASERESRSTAHAD
jgi:N-methylhydantoinase B